MSECTREWDVWGQVGRGLGEVFKEVRTATSVATVGGKALYSKSQQSLNRQVLLIVFLVVVVIIVSAGQPQGCRDTHKLLPNNLSPS